MTRSVGAGARFDLLCVGDVAVDVYLTVSELDAVAESGESGRRLVLPFGAKIACDVTTTVAAGGNSANVAVACSRLGLRVGLVAYAGTDRAGRDAVDALHDEGVDSFLVRLDPLVPTNRNFVLRVGHERTILVHHEQHDCHWPYLRPVDVPSWLFLSSVGRDAGAYEDQIADWLDANPQVSLAFEPGTLQIARGARALARHYRRAALVVCNREEAALLTGIPADGAPADLLDGMLALGPRWAVVTDGSAGAFGTDGTCYLEVPVFPDDAPVVDRTGAGDAFAATLVAAVASGRSLEDAMLRAPVNSMRAVQQVGTQAGLLRADALEALLADAPAGYGVRELRR
jgi:sugar/nucleoside kinase (ribokinase family)